MNAVSPTNRVFEQSRNALEDESERQGGVNTYHISVNYRLSSEVLFFYYFVMVQSEKQCRVLANKHQTVRRISSAQSARSDELY